METSPDYLIRMLVILKSAFSMTLLFWPISAMLLIGAFLSAQSLKKEHLSRKNLLLLAPLGLTLLVTIWGGFGSSLPFDWQYHAINVITYLYIPISALGVYACKGFCVTPICITLLESWYFYWVLFVAGMGATGAGF